MSACGYTVGVLVNTNFGNRHNLTIAGVPVGREIQDLMPAERGHDKPAEGSCMVVIATNAPLHPPGLQRLARRAGLGLARTGSTANNGSGEIFLAKTLQIGWAVKINHGDYIVTIYGHLNHFIVKVWQNVTV